MSKVTEEQRSLETEKRMHILNMTKSRRALGGDSSLPKITPINSPSMSHFMMKNPNNRKPLGQLRPSIHGAPDLTIDNDIGGHGDQIRRFA